MTAWEEVLLKVRSAADTVGKKTSELTDTVKLKTKSAQIQKEMAATFEGMGRLLYDSRQSGRDVSDLLENSAVRIDGLQVELQQVEDELCAYKGAVRCPACRAIVDNDAAFCPRCGHPMTANGSPEEQVESETKAETEAE